MRGKILRDTNSGSGLLNAQGQQYEFTLEHHWKSETPPTVGMVVDVLIDANGELSLVNPVSDEQLAKEQADLVMKATKEKSKQLLENATTRFGMPVLIAWGTLIVSWFFLDAVSMDFFGKSIGITFWNLLGSGISMSGWRTHDQGILGLLAVVAIAGPAIAQFWKNPLAYLGACLPLAVMVGAFAKVYFSLSGLAQEQLGMSRNNELYSEITAAAMKAMMGAIHIGIGAWIAVVASGFLAFIGAKQYLVAKAKSN